MNKNVIVKYLEVMDPKNPKHPDLNAIAQELGKQINEIERQNNVTLFQVSFLGEDSKHTEGFSKDIKFSIPYDKIWKYMLFFR